MNLSTAVTFAQKVRGTRIRRNSWPSGIYVVYQEGYPNGIAINQNTADATGIPKGTVCKFQPYLMLCVADNSFEPYIPSMSDLLETDWVVDQ